MSRSTCLLLLLSSTVLFSLFFFFNDPATTEIYTLSLHDALPICEPHGRHLVLTRPLGRRRDAWALHLLLLDRKSTRLNSSHANISYAVFCLKKKKKQKTKHMSTTDTTQTHTVIKPSRVFT